MSKVIEIHIAEMFAGNDEYVITTNGVGSCIVILLYDRVMRIGGMAHAILPRARAHDPSMVEVPRDHDGRRFVKYADRAVDLLLADMLTLGASRERIVAKLVGGARMFALLEGDKYGIGHTNTEVARARLHELGVMIETEVTGGTVGRNVRFDCATGIAEITTKV
jgi:chemotaxis protein CheD